MKDFTNEINGYALKNAMEFGKADAGRILPKLFNHGLDKKEIKNVMSVVQEIVKKVNSLKKEDMEKEFGKFKEYVKEHEEKERTLAELPNTSDKMVFRLAPYPSGALHIGNAKTYLLNALYAEKYGGKILFVMDDTIGSEEKSIMPESYKLLEEAFKWLKVKYELPVYYKSDRLEIYYDYALQLMKKGKAYVCHCAQEELRENRAKERECGCRQFPPAIQLKRWKDMFTAKMGEAVLRLKTSMQDPNPAFRDRVLFKISDKEHPRVGKKYRVWPTLDMCWAIDDHLLGITHIIRGNDLMIETDMEKYIWDIFKWKHPETIHAGLIKIEGIEGAKLSKSKAQAEVKSGAFSGWDDPRTWSIQSLSRRGIRVEAVREFISSIGLNKQDITTPIDALYAINRKLIDLEADRYYFVPNAVELEIKNAPKTREIEVPVHPDKPKETMKMRITPGRVWISKEDYENFKGKEVRLLHLFNMELKEKNKAEFTTTGNMPIPKITWVSFPVKARVLMPDGQWVEGLADENITGLKEGEVLQFERFGFCRYDGGKDGVHEFWFSHK